MNRGDVYPKRTISASENAPCRLNFDLTGAEQDWSVPRRQHGAAFAVNLAMSSELTVQPVAVVHAGNDAVAEVKTVTQPAAGSEQAPPRLPIINPNLRLDPALGLVVIEFRDDASGAITTSIPSQRQLEAYQRWGLTHSGPTPNGLPQPASQVHPEPEPHARVPPAEPTTVKASSAAAHPVGTPRRQSR